MQKVKLIADGYPVNGQKSSQKIYLNRADFNLVLTCFGVKKNRYEQK